MERCGKLEGEEKGENMRVFVVMRKEYFREFNRYN